MKHPEHWQVSLGNLKKYFPLLNGEKESNCSSSFSHPSFLVHALFQPYLWHSVLYFLKQESLQFLSDRKTSGLSWNAGNWEDKTSALVRDQSQTVGPIRLAWENRPGQCSQVKSRHQLMGLGKSIRKRLELTMAEISSSEDWNGIGNQFWCLLLLLFSFSHGG